MPSTEFIYGVTIDTVTGIPDITNSLKKLGVKPTARIVFDDGKSPEFYLEAVKEIGKVSFVMGEILDSYDVKNITTEAYRKRTKEYLNTLGSFVDIWEIGNEINGEWLGDGAVAKMTAAYQEVKTNGKKTALTLYYNEGCWEKKANEVFLWAKKYVPADMKKGLDYVFFSYYEDDCGGRQPNWPAAFKKLAVIFPNSKIGFGEVGTKNGERKAEFIKRYYKMQISEPNYVGGYFWWYFSTDMVPATKPLWNTLNGVLQQR